MNFDEYKKAYYVDPPPDPRFSYVGLNGISLYFSDYKEAVQYYEQVFGPPAYVEGEWTRGWRIGNSWLTLFPSKEGNPKNAEVTLVMKTLEEAERLQTAFIKAGGTGDDPSDEFMYEPIRFCPAQDPFGTNFLIVCPLA